MIVRKYLVAIVCISLVWSASGILLNKSQTDYPVQQTILSADPYVRVVNKTSPACTTGDFYYSTIQDAVDAASSGDTIIVCPGVYLENVERDYIDSLAIVSYAGPEVTIIDASTQNIPGIAIGACNYLVISGFTIIGAVGQYLGVAPNAGIFLVLVEHASVSNNRLLGNNFGIWLAQINYSTIEHNDIRDNTFGIGNHDGVYGDNRLSNNIIRYNTLAANDYGLYLYGELGPCTNNTICYNHIVSNGYGLYVNGSSVNNTVSFNNIVNSTNYEFYNSQSANVSAKLNWWGTASETLINEKYL